MADIKNKTTSTLNNEDLKSNKENIKIVEKSKNKNDERLIMTKMVLVNFKSYKGKLEIGPFHKRFSSIVGPNGSGKSNVIDALLFVFGRRASEIRFKKITDLVYKAQDNSSPGFCSVNIHFCSIIDQIEHDEDYKIVENSQFVVSREVTLKGASKYLINGKNVNFSEISSLLKTKGIDLNNNRFLILQGEVESIAQMKPMAVNANEKGLLEYLEEIIGSGHYAEKIQNSLEKLEQCTELRQESLSRMKIVEKEKNSLEESKDEAVEYLQKNLQLSETKHNLQNLHLHYLKKGMECIISNKNKLIKQEEKEKEKLEECNLKYKAASETLELEKETFYKIDKKCKLLMERFNELEDEDAKINVSIRYNQKKCKTIRSKIKYEKNKIDKIEETFNFNKVEVPKLEARFKELEKEKIEIEAKIDKVFKKLQSKTGGIRQELEEKQQKLIPFKNIVNKNKQKVDSIQSKINILKENIDRNKEKIKNYEENYQNLIQKKQNEENDLKEIQATCESNVSREQNDIQNLHKIREKLNKIIPKVRELRALNDKAKNAFEKSKSTAGILGELMRLKNNDDRFSGVFDRLGELGSIDSKYDIAVSTASNLLNSILVDSAETGQKCIHYIKSKKLGIASFMMLDKQQHLRKIYERPISTPENAPRLFDLIAPKDPKFLPAFYCALGDTLFAEDIDQAVRISNDGRKRWRVVTSKGELLDKSGTIEGGGNKVRRGAMSHKAKGFDASENGVEAKRIEEELFDFVEKEKKLRDAERNLQNRINSTRNEKDSKRLELSKIKIDISNTKSNIEEIEKKMAKIKNQMKNDLKKENEIKDLVKILKRNKIDLEKSNAKCDEINKDCKILEKKIFDIGGSKLKKFKEEKEEIVKEMDAINLKITEMKVTITHGEKRMKDSQEKIETLKENHQTVVEQLKSLDLKTKNIEENATKLLDDHKKEKEKREAEKAKLQEKEETIKTAEIDAKNIRLSLIDIENQLSDFDRNINSNQSKITQKEKKKSKLQQKIEKLTEILKMADTQPKTPNCLSEEQIAALNKEELEQNAERFAAELQEMNPNMSVIEEYRAKMAEYSRRMDSLGNATKLAEKAKCDYDMYRKARQEEFMAGLRIITAKLKEMYQLLTLGGDAELECVDRFDPFAEGVEFSVRPHRKSWKNISNLSGGEKTLSSLSLVFALHFYKPAPLYVMDEIDAALDFKNVAIVANYVKKRTKNAQFVIISLRHSMFEAANRLVGVYKTCNFSKSITIDPNGFKVV